MDSSRQCQALIKSGVNLGNLCTCKGKERVGGRFGIVDLKLTLSLFLILALILTLLIDLTLTLLSALLLTGITVEST